MSIVTCNWIHLCDYATLDQRKKTILVGIFHNISAGAVPALHPTCAVVFELQGPAANIEVSIALVAPSGAEVLSTVRPVELKGGDGRALTIMNLVGLPLPEFGRYRFVVAVEGKTLNEATLDVIRTA